jgi:hypothetical protein
MIISWAWNLVAVESSSAKKMLLYPCSSKWPITVMTWYDTRHILKRQFDGTGNQRPPRPVTGSRGPTVPLDIFFKNYCFNWYMWIMNGFRCG